MYCALRCIKALYRTSAALAPLPSNVMAELPVLTIADCNLVTLI